MNKKIYVIIVTWNGMKWLKECMDALETSVYPVETVVIDNGSTDGTVAFIKENYSAVHLIESGRNLGFGQANNEGMRYALKQGADYVYLLNQDAYVYPDMFTELIRVAEMPEYSDYAILSPLHVHGDRSSLDIQFKDYIREASADMVENMTMAELKDVYALDCVPAAGWLLPVSTLKTIGGFDPIYFHYGEDVQYAQRVKYHGLKIGVVPSAKMVHDRETFGNVSVYKKGEIFRGLKAYVLLDINLSTRGRLTKLLHHGLYYAFDSVKCLCRGDFRMIGEYWSAFGQVLGTASKFRRNRKANKQKGDLWL